MQAGGSAMAGAEISTIHGVGDQRLWMHRARHVPALVIVGIERLKIDVMGVAGRSGEARELADSDANPLRAGIPSFHAKVVDTLRDAWQLREVVERQRQRLPNGSGN